MPDKVRPTVPEAVRAFLIVCGGASDVWERMERFVNKLRAGPRWSQSEVDDMQRLIVERLTA